ncbi:hypothetical protein ACXR2U_00965 [Jatrophihabitans sp. YIM 134969]
MTGLTGAIIAGVVALLVAIGTQVELARRERRARVYERRRQALLDTQGAVVAMRGRLREYGLIARAGAGMPSPELDEAQRRFDDARVLVTVTLTRVEDRRVIDATESWAVDAQQRFVSTQDVSPRDEDADWDALHEAFAAALRSATGLGPALKS